MDAHRSARHQQHRLDHRLRSVRPRRSRRRLLHHLQLQPVEEDVGQLLGRAQVEGTPSQLVGLGFQLAHPMAEIIGQVSKPVGIDANAGDFHVGEHRRQVVRKPQIDLVARVAQPGDRLGGDRVEFDGFGVNVQRSRLEPAQIEQVADQRVEAVDLTDGGADDLVGVPERRDRLLAPLRLVLALPDAEAGMVEMSEKFREKGSEVYLPAE